MIPINKLRIGNLIHRPDLVSRELRFEKILYLGQRVTCTGPVKVICDYEDLEPIPLTEECLLKFGFEKCLNGFWCAKELLNVKISKHFVTEIYLSGSDTDLAFNGIQYIHQLQNLYFALTGEELTLSVT